MKIKEFIYKFINEDYNYKKKLYNQKKKYYIYENKIYVRAIRDGEEKYILMLTMETDILGNFFMIEDMYGLNLYRMLNVIKKTAGIYSIGVIDYYKDRNLRNEYSKKKYRKILNEYISSSDVIDLILNLLLD